MNITDIKNVPLPDDRTQMWPMMFVRQRGLMEKYAIIETKNGANHPIPPYELDSKFVQWRIKDELWRFTEELAEAQECEDGYVGTGIQFRAEGMSDLELHFFEELADALHFIIEASIFANLDELVIESIGDPAKWPMPNLSRNPIEESFAALAWNVVADFGIAANCLKNKPWKMTQMPTDRDRFAEKWLHGWDSVVTMFATLGMTSEDVFQFYMRKAAVNDFRQRSNY